MIDPYAPTDARIQTPHPRQVAWEAGRVALALRHFDLGAHAAEMRRWYALEYGQGADLTFEAFRKFFPLFPLTLAARSLYGVSRRCGPADLFRSFPQTIICQCYLETYSRLSAEAGGTPVGLVIPFGGLRAGAVIHNGDFDSRGTRLVHDLPGDVPPHRVTVEPFAALLRHIARGGWTPSTPVPSLRTQRPRVRRGFRLARWMVRLLGAGPDTVVLGFLCSCLRCRSGYYRRYVRRWAGERLVAIDRPALAWQTGLSESQVKRAVESLRGRGLIRTARRKWHGALMTHYRLDRDAIRAERERLADPE
jgi:hypothetical protein